MEDTPEEQESPSTESGDMEQGQAEGNPQNTETLTDMHTHMREQSAIRLIDSVQEGRNRGFGRGEENNSGSKAW